MEHVAKSKVMILKTVKVKKKSLNCIRSLRKTLVSFTPANKNTPPQICSLASPLPHNTLHQNQFYFVET